MPSTAARFHPWPGATGLTAGRRPLGSAAAGSGADARPRPQPAEASTVARTAAPSPATPGADFALLTFAGLGEVAAAELAVCARRDVTVTRLPNHDLVRCRLAP